MTRLMKSFSSGGARPISEPRPCSAAHDDVAGLIGGELAGPAVRAAEDDDVARRRVGEPVGDLVDQHPVVLAAGAAVQRGLHRPRRDHVDLRDERLDEEREHQRDDDEDRQFFPERRPAPLAPSALAARTARGRRAAGRSSGDSPARRRWRPGKPARAVVGLLRHGLGGPGEAGRHGGLLHRLGAARSRARPCRRRRAGHRSTCADGRPHEAGDVAVDAARRAVGGRQRVPATVLRAADRVDRGQRMAAAVLRTGGRRRVHGRQRMPAALLRPVPGIRRRAVGNGEAGDVAAVGGGWAARRGRCAAGRGRWRAGARGPCRRRRHPRATVWTAAGRGVRAHRAAPEPRAGPSRTRRFCRAAEAGPAGRRGARGGPRSRRLRRTARGGQDAEGVSRFSLIFAALPRRSRR